MEKRKQQLRGKTNRYVQGLVSQNLAEDHSYNHAGPFIVTASIAGTYLGSGSLQSGLPLAQDLRLIRTRPEKVSGVTIEVVV
jgi:hypothetical protein